jgi:hypothetical protein
MKRKAREGVGRRYCGESVVVRSKVKRGRRNEEKAGRRSRM